MNVLLWIIACCVIGFALLLAFSLCRTAAISDRRMEKEYEDLEP